MRWGTTRRRRGRFVNCRGRIVKSDTAIVANTDVDIPLDVSSIPMRDVRIVVRSSGTGRIARRGS